MSGGNRIPDYQREMAEMRAELRQIRQALARVAALPPVQKQMGFSWSGTASGTKLSGPWPAESDLTITGCKLGCTVPAGTATATLVIDGVDLFTFTMAAGATQGGTQRNFTVPIGSVTRLRVSGGGVQEFTAFLSYITAAGW